LKPEGPWNLLEYFPPSHPVPSRKTIVDTLNGFLILRIPGLRKKGKKNLFPSVFHAG
jgi:hypothetical protein